MARRPSSPHRPTAGKIPRRRRVAVLLAGLATLAVIYAVLELTVLAPADRDGAEVVQLTIHSREVGADLGVQVVIPAADVQPTHRRPLLVFLHGQGGSDTTFTENEAFFRALAALGRPAPVVAFPDGGEDSYWHNRATGRWGSYVTGEVIPAVIHRFHLDPHRVAIGGISMGGFGAYDIALDHPGRFCAVGGHSPALWLEGGATAPGAFDDVEDFERNDVIGAVRADPGAFGAIPIWNDYGTEDPFLIGNVAFGEALAGGGADLTAHEWHGGHEQAYWDRHWETYLRFYTKALAACGT